MGDGLVNALITGAVVFVGTLFGGAALGAALLAGGIAAGLGVVAYLLADKPDFGDLSNPDEIKLTLRQATPHRNYIFGKRRVGGIELMKSTRRDPEDEDAPENDGYLDWVQIIADHPCEAVDAVYINGERVFFDDDGDVVPPADVDEKVDEAVEQIRTEMPHVSRGQALAIAGITGEQDQRDTQERYEDHAHIEFRLDGTSPAFPSLDEHFNWNSEVDKATGCALLYFRGLWDREVYPNGEPDIEVVVRGCNTIKDPRNSNKAGWTDNPALIIAWILENWPNLNARQVDQQALIDAANACDMEVSFQGPNRNPVMQKKYRMNAFMRLDEDVQRVLTECSKSIGGQIFYSHVGNGWRIFPGRARTPMVELSDEDIVGGVEMVPKTPIENRSNTIYGHFVSPEHEWELTALKPTTDQLFKTADKVELIEQIDFLYVTDVAQAARLARQYLAEKRAEIEISLSIKDFETGMSLGVGEAVRLTYAPMGVDAMTFIVISWAPLFTDSNELSFALTLRQHNTQAFIPSINFKDYEVVPPLRSDLLSPRYVPLLRGLSAQSGAEQLRVLQDGTVISRIELMWRKTRSPYAADVEISYRKTSEDEDTARTLIGRGQRAYIPQVEDGVEYTIEARYRNSLGVRGRPATITHTVVGKSEKPATPTYLHGVQRGTEVELFLNAPPDRDVRGVRVKYERIDVADTPTDLPEIEDEADWNEAEDAGTFSIPPPSIGVSQVSGRISVDRSGRYRFAARFVDTSGNESGFITVHVLFVRLDQHQVTLGYAPLWEGEKNGYFVHDGELLPDGAKLASEVTAAEWLETFAGPQFAAGASDTFTFTRQATLDGTFSFTPRLHGGNRGLGATPGFLWVGGQLTQEGVPEARFTSLAIGATGALLGTTDNDFTIVPSLEDATFQQVTGMARKDNHFWILMRFLKSGSTVTIPYYFSIGSDGLLTRDSSKEGVTISGSRHTAFVMGDRIWFGSFGGDLNGFDINADGTLSINAALDYTNPLSGNFRGAFVRGDRVWLSQIDGSTEMYRCWKVSAAGAFTRDADNDHDYSSDAGITLAVEGMEAVGDFAYVLQSGSGVNAVRAYSITASGGAAGSREIDFAPAAVELPDPIAARITRAHVAKELLAASTEWQPGQPFPLLDEQVNNALPDQAALTYDYEWKAAASEANFADALNVDEIENYTALQVLKPTAKQTVDADNERGYKYQAMTFRIDKTN